MMFEVKKLFVTARSVTLELPDGGLYNTKQPYRILVNGEEWGTANTVVHSIYGLWPDTKYVVKVLDESGEVGRIAFRTEEESYTLNVRRFGAVGDGVHDDTAAIQADKCTPANAGALFFALDKTGEEKYREAIRQVMAKLNE